MTSNTLPDQIPPQSTPWSYTNEDGEQVVEIHWYLFLYGLWIQVSSLIAGGAVLQPAVNIAMIDSDAVSADSLQDSRRIINAMLLQEISDAGPTSRDIANVLALQEGPDIGPTLRDVANSLALASDVLLQDPAPRAQPASAVTVGASPFTFTANFSGTLAVSGGTVSAIAVIRQATTVPTGVIAGLILVSRQDQVQITYTVIPTVNFLPT